MGYEFVDYKIEDGIATVTIDRPPANALSPRLLDELTKVFDEIAGDDSVGVVILTGAGDKIFVAGADIDVLLEVTPDSGEEYCRHGQSVIQDKVRNSPKVVICAINGVAVGGGNELAMACDIRVASENAKFGQPEVNLGVIPGAGGTQLLPRLIPPSKAKELIFTGDMIDAQEAKNLGLVDHVVAKGQAVEKAREIAKKINTKGPLAIRAAKKAINDGLSMPLDEGLKMEAHYWFELCGTEDQKEGARAFLEKRKPQFKGR